VYLIEQNKRTFVRQTYKYNLLYMSNEKDLQLASDLRTVVTRLIKKLRKETITGQQFSLTERSTLALLLQHGGMLPSELAAVEKITNQSMSQIVNNLFHTGLIIRTNSETDKRKVIISLTPAGEQMIMQVRYEREAWLAKALKETCTHEEQEIIKQAIGPLTKILDFK
jgi:DNA-binding MarR family transcriptional regulator